MWENKGGQHSREVWDLLALGSGKGWRFVSSELTLAEILVKPISEAKKTGDWSLADTYRFHIFDKGSFQRIVPVSRDILDRAANVRSENEAFKLPDAIHLATALQENCTVFISNDTRMVTAVRRALVPKHMEVAVTFSELSQMAAIA